MTTAVPPRPTRPGFRHEALLYAGDTGFVDATAAFIREGLEAEEPILVVVGAAKIGLLRSELGATAADVEFADMEEVGRNPARIIPAWRDYVDARGDAPRIRGIGEPIWDGRPPAELVESQHHEALLNVAFVDTAAMWLICPYDTEALAPAVIDEAFRSHPHVMRNGQSSASLRYEGPDRIGERFNEALPEPAVDAPALEFGSGDLAFLRSVVAYEADRAALDPWQRADLTLAVSEVAANSLRHGGGRGTLRTWQEDDSLICEIRDDGCVKEPLVGRERPGPFQTNRRGLWLANQLCDLVQLRTSTAGTTVRLHVRRRTLAG